MNTPSSSSKARRLLVVIAALCLLAIASFVVVSSRMKPAVPGTTGAGAEQASKAVAENRTRKEPTSQDAAREPGLAAKAVPSLNNAAATAVAPGPLLRTAEGRIAPSALADFEAIPFPGGQPAYDGEKVTAYVASANSGRKIALTVNQLGEFPRVWTNPSEPVEVRLAFTSTRPGSHVAVAAQDGGKFQGGVVSAALQVDDARQIAFAFTVSANPGMHRVSVTTPDGERKTLEFWAGPPSTLMSSAGL